jgi:hypothetical protein
MLMLVNAQYWAASGRMDGLPGAQAVRLDGALLALATFWFYGTQPYRV